MLNLFIAAVILSQCPIETEQPLTTPGGLSGTSVAIDGDLAVIGSPLAVGTEWASGMVLVYRLQNGVWAKEAELVADDIDSGDMMGVSVSVSGSRVVAGAWFEDHAGSNSGAAYIFEHNGSAWSQTAKLTASDGSAEDTFGRRVGIDGDICVVTAPLDDDNGVSSGSAYVFQYNADKSNWSQQQKLIAKIGSEGDQFGLGLSMNDNAIAVGAPWANNGAGQVHIFNRISALFVESQTLTDPNPQPKDNFGFGLDIDEEWLAVGSYHDADVASDAGSVFLFAQTFDDDWALEQQLYPAGAMPGEQYGVSVALDDSVLFVGHRFGVSDGVNTGSASTYDWDGDSWGYRSTAMPAEGSSEGEFGWSVAVDGSHGIVGAPWHAPDGYAEIFDGMNGSCGCVEDVDGDGMVNVTDLLAVIAAWGSDCNGCQEDVNGDENVNVADLLQLIAGWGSCE